VVVLHRLSEDERAGAGLEGLAGEVLAARLDGLARDHHPGAVDELSEESGEWRGEREAHRRRIDDVDLLDRRELTRARRALGGLVALDVPLHRLRVEGGAVVVLHVLAQVEGVRLAVVGDGPLLRQPRDDLALLVDAHERVVDLVVDVAVDEGP
jgi:hypothetical protein